MRCFFEVRGIRGLFFSLLVALLFLILSLTNAFTPADSYIMDHIIQHEGKCNTDIKIIGIDDKTLDELGKMDTWDRGYYATLIDKLNRTQNKPSVIGFDILFTGKSESNEADSKLVEAVKASDNIVLGMNLLFKTGFSDAEINDSIEVSYPFKELNEVASTGYVNTVLDRHDSYVRKVIPRINEYESFSYSIYRRYMEGKKDVVNTYSANKYYRFKYTSRPNTSYTVISFTDILNDRIPLDDFKDSIVLVGAYATGLGDDFYTPIKHGVRMNGVEIHANLIDAYTNNNLLVDFNNIAYVILGFILVFIISYILYGAKPLAASIIASSSVIALILAEIIGALLKLYLALNLLILLVALAYIYEIAYSYLAERRAKLNTINAFKKYVAPQVVDKAIQNGKFEINLGGEKKMVACLFVDIRGFTTMSEAMEPASVVEILNSYLGLVTDAIFKNGGTLDKFIGDAAMALFNAPFDLEDYIYKACLCAIDIRSGSEALDKKCMEDFNRSVGFGIGINVGEAVVGNIGSEARMDFTAIGDTINTASRLEGSAKRGEIIISESVYLNVMDRINCEYIGELSLKGKRDGFRAYKIIGLKEE